MSVDEWDQDSQVPQQWVCGVIREVLRGQGERVHIARNMPELITQWTGKEEKASDWIGSSGLSFIIDQSNRVFA